ncbi:MAG: hypothetical protein O9346_01775 [Leptospiraceae bacterium]|jgi:hypothetical protein|nr:hypothetical protein [Leptospiraceae bacterium]
MKTLTINSDSGHTQKVFETWKSIKSGRPIPGHYQYRADVEITEFKDDFSKRVYNAIIASGRKNLANKYVSDINKNERVVLFNGKMEYDETTEIGRKFAYVYGNRLARIEDFKFFRLESDPNIWWEKNIQQIKRLINGSGWVEINGEKITWER